jgi:predicted membrane protein
MNTNRKNKSLLFAILSIVFMVAGGYLFVLTINKLYFEYSALVCLALSLIAVFIYVAGVSWLAQSVRYMKAYALRGGTVKSVQFALLLITYGALMLCFNASVLSPTWKSFILSWPMLVFVIGAMCLCRFRILSGFLFAAIGKFFLIKKVHAMYPYDIQVEQLMTYIWPAGIILLGIIILVYFIAGPKRCFGKEINFDRYVDFRTDENDTIENNDGKINYRFVFSGTEQVILDPVFKGGMIEATFGGMELDLRRTSLPEGETFLHVNATFGGVEISAPDTWDIEIKSNTFAGGVSDERPKVIDKDRSRKLVIIAKCTFGGITIK